MEFDALSSRGFDSWRSLEILLEFYWNPIRVLLVVSDSFSWDEMFDWISWEPGIGIDVCERHSLRVMLWVVWVTPVFFYTF